MDSCIYEGLVRHRRFSPIEKTFQYSLFMMYLDLEELSTLFDRHWLWSNEKPNLAYFRRRDHLGPKALPLDEAVRRLVEDKLGYRVDGPIRLLTHLCYFGYRFNPVSFYYCFDASGKEIEVILAEINNTPFGDQHVYVLDRRKNLGTKGKMRFSLTKDFYISPFIEMDCNYEWFFTPPGQSLSVHMANFREDQIFFDTTLTMNCNEINTCSLARVLIKYPFMTLKVIAAIYWQAHRLRSLGLPQFDYPPKGKKELETV